MNIGRKANVATRTIVRMLEGREQHDQLLTIGECCLIAAIVQAAMDGKEDEEIESIFPSQNKQLYENPLSPETE